MRLLLHRLATPRHPQNPFNWCLPTETSTLPHSPQHIGYTIPSTQMSVLALIGHWLESFPDDFLDFSELQPEVNKVVKRLRLTRGPFIPHTHRLRSLMQDLGRPRNEKHSTSVEEELRVPHHDNLYQLVSVCGCVFDVYYTALLICSQCKQMVTGGHLPVTLDEAIYISALQLHIEVSQSARKQSQQSIHILTPCRTSMTPSPTSPRPLLVQLYPSPRRGSRCE